VTGQQVFLGNMPEAAFQSWVMSLATRLGWMVCHYRPAIVRGGRYVTPIQGHAGAPDLILAKGGRVILAELKRNGQHPSTPQRVWLAALGDYGRVWRPKDAQAVYDELSAA
jgi:hypothetical protein